MDTLDIGEVTTLEGLFRNGDGELANPSAVTLTITKPDGTSSTPATVHASTGRYTYELTVDQLGLWLYRFEGTGTVAAGETHYLHVGGSAAVSRGLCEDWCCVADVLECRPDLEGHEDAIAREIPVSSFILFKLTGERWPGLCAITRSFCAPGVGCGCWPGKGWCGCSPRSRIDLGEWPVAGVLRVTVIVDDVAVDLVRGVDYRVDDWRWLVRLGDGEHWPTVLDLTDPEALEIEWVAGMTPETGGRESAALLAGERAAACVDLPCKLPQRITGVNSEGVTYTLIDPTAIIRDGATGLDNVDQWIYAVNKPPPSGMFDPARRHRRRAVATNT